MRNNTRNWMGMVIVGIVCLVIGFLCGHNLGRIVERALKNSGYNQGYQMGQFHMRMAIDPEAFALYLREADGNEVFIGDYSASGVVEMEPRDVNPGDRLFIRERPRPCAGSANYTKPEVPIPLGVYRTFVRYSDGMVTSGMDEYPLDEAVARLKTMKRARPALDHWVEEMVDPGHPDEYYLGDPAEKLSPEHEAFISDFTSDMARRATAELEEETTSPTIYAAVPDPWPKGLPSTCRIYYDDGSTTSWSVAPPEGVSRNYDYWQLVFQTREPEPEPVIQEWTGPEAGLPLPISPDDYTIHFHTDSMPVEGEMPDPGIVMPPDPVPESPSHIERGFFGSHTMTKAVADEVERQKAINRAREESKCSR